MDQSLLETRHLLAVSWEKEMSTVKIEIEMSERKVAREHDTESDGECWCNPTLHYVDEKTGRKVWVHKSDEELNQ